MHWKEDEYDKEGLPSFFDALGKNEAEWVIHEEEYSNKMFGYKTLLPQILGKYKESFKRTDKSGKIH